MRIGNPTDPTEPLQCSESKLTPCLVALFVCRVKIEVAKSGLCASLLVENPDDEELYLNFDSEILTLFRDTECMIRFGLEIPLAARVLMTKQADFKHLVNSMVVSVTSHVGRDLSFFSFLGSRNRNTNEYELSSS